MSFEKSQKFKKVFVFIILGMLAVSVIWMCAIGFLAIRNKETSQNDYVVGSDKPSLAQIRTSSGGGIGGYITDQSMTSEKIAPAPSSLEVSETATTNIMNPGNLDNSGAPIIIERKLMQDGTLSLVVTKLEDSVNSLSGIATNLGGRVDSVDYQNAEGSAQKTATIILRVPSANFTSAMNQIKSVARKVTSENISTRDVTEQFVDMQARLKTLKATEEQYLGVMQKAVKIEDILSVSRYLSDVRTQIEQLQGQMNYLSRQVDMSIITVYLTSEPDVSPSNVIWNPKTTALDAMSNFVQTIFSWGNAIIVVFLFYLPILILLCGIAYLIFLFFAKAVRPWYEASKDLFHF